MQCWARRKWGTFISTLATVSDDRQTQFLPAEPRACSFQFRRQCGVIAMVMGQGAYRCQHVLQSLIVALAFRQCRNGPICRVVAARGAFHNVDISYWSSPLHCYAKSSFPWVHWASRVANTAHLSTVTVPKVPGVCDAVPVNARVLAKRFVKPEAQLTTAHLVWGNIVRIMSTRYQSRKARPMQTDS